MEVKDRTKVTSASLKASAAQRGTVQPHQREDHRDRSRKRKRERAADDPGTEHGGVPPKRAPREGQLRDKSSVNRVEASTGSDPTSNEAIEDLRIYEPPKKRRPDSVQRSIRLVAEGVQKSSKHPLARARHIAPHGRVTVRSIDYWSCVIGQPG